MQAGCWREGGVEYHHPRTPHEMVCRWQCTLVKPWSERGHSHGMLVLGLESEVSAGSVSSQAVHTDLPPTPPCASLTPVPRSSLDGGPPAQVYLYRGLTCTHSQAQPPPACATASRTQEPSGPPDQIFGTKFLSRHQWMSNQFQEAEARLSSVPFSSPLRERQ